jgi:hypothetical protein
MLTRRLAVLLFFLCLSSAYSLAQKADAAFVVGGSFVSDSKVVFTTSPSFTNSFQTGHHIFLEGALGVRVFDAKAASLHIELPIAAIPSQKLTFSNSTTAFDHLSTVFITPGFRLKIAPSAPITPWVSVGGGWAHYSADFAPTTNKGAIQYGGGLDFRTPLPHLRIRGEVRDFVTGDPNLFQATFPPGTGQPGIHRHNVLLGGGVVLTF